MANRILIVAGWQQRILDKLGVDVAYLPFTVIENPENVTIAEANIIKQVPDYASLTGDDLVYLEAAVICECSALLCPGMPARLPVRQQGPSETHELSVDWTQKKADFENERDGYICSISTVVVPSFSHFSISNPSHRCIRQW